jgi:AraC family transcriptional activator of tynA and feaB
MTCPDPRVRTAQAELSRIFGTLRIRRAYSNPDMKFTHIHLQHGVFFEGVGPSLLVHKIADNGGKFSDYICAFLVKEGTVEIVRSGSRISLGASQMALFDQGQDITFDYNGPHRIQSLLLHKAAISAHALKSLWRADHAIDATGGPARVFGVIAGDLSGLVGEGDLRGYPSTAVWNVIAVTIENLLLSEGANGSEDLRFALVVSFVRANHRCEDLDREQIAEHAGVSVRTLSRLLAKRGLNVTQLVQRVRLDAARNFLTNSMCAHLAVSDIAFDVGFRDPAHFSQAFRRTFGVSPGAYRQQAQRRSST